MKETDKRPGGRPRKSPEDRAGVGYAIRLTTEQRRVLELLGGAQWVRDKIDTARRDLELVKGTR